MGCTPAWLVHVGKIPASMNQQSILRNLIISGALLGAAILARAEAAFDEAPVPVQAVQPVLSSELRSAGLSGMVSIKVTIDEKGNVTQATVAKSSNSQFEQPALEAVNRWKFRPAKKAGQPVVAQVMVPLRFTASN